MINQKQMADAYKAADTKVLSVPAKANGFRNVNQTGSISNTLRKDLIAAGVTEQAARKLAQEWQNKANMVKP